MKKKKKNTDIVLPDVSQLPPIPDNSVSDQSSVISIPTQSKAPDDVFLASKDTGNHKYDGWCQAFVEHATLGKTGVFPSAIDAWQAQQDKAVSGLNGIKAGDPIYFSPNQSNDGYGHTGIYAGDNKFISATDNGIKTIDLKEWSKATGQQVLGYLKETK